MDESSRIIITSVIALLVWAGIVAYIYIKKKNNKENEKELEMFLESMRITFEGFIIKYIDTIEIDNLTNLSEVQIQILNDLYDQLWQITIDNLGNIHDEFSAGVIRKLLTRKNLESFIKQIFESDIIQEKFTSKYNNTVLSASKEFAKYESDMDKYTNTFLKDEKEKNTHKVIDDLVDNSPINPQKDEEEQIDANDSSIEFVD